VSDPVVMRAAADPAEALRLAEEVVRLAEGAGASEAEALVVAGESALTRFANSEIHQNVASTEVFVNLRVARGQRIGVASTGRLDTEGLRALVARATDIAGNVEELEDWAGLPEPDATAPQPLAAAWADATANATPELRADGARAVIAAADAAGVTAYGSFSTDAEAIAVASSRGIRVAERRTASQMLIVTMGPENGTGYAEQAAVDATTIDAAVLGREAAERARASRNPVDIAPGDYPVVLNHYAVVDLLDMVGYLGFSALAVQEDRSFFEAGKTVASPLVTIADDGRDPAGLPMGFDAEGARGGCRTNVIQRQADSLASKLEPAADNGARRVRLHRPVVNADRAAASQARAGLAPVERFKACSQRRRVRTQREVHGLRIAEQWIGNDSAAELSDGLPAFQSPIGADSDGGAAGPEKVVAK